MPKEIENLCCHEQTEVFSHKKDYPCITKHPGFAEICLARYMLDVVYVHYRRDYGKRGVHPKALHRRFRYTAYRQFVMWTWGRLGPDVRVPIPSCVVNCIRQAFPSEGQDYTGFMLAES